MALLRKALRGCMSGWVRVGAPWGVYSIKSKWHLPEHNTGDSNPGIMVVYDITL